MQTQQHQNTIRIAAAILNTQHLKLYKPDGEVITLNQGDARIRPILDQAVPQINRQGYADISLEELVPVNSYTEFEEKSNGVVKFFRVAKSKLAGLFKSKEEAPLPEALEVGTIPQQQSQDAQSKAVVEEILKHAVPASAPTFSETTVAKQANVVEASGDTPGAHTSDNAPDTIIAVVDNKIVPGVEKIKSQFGRAAKLGSTKGMENFLKRLSSVIHDRKHSVDDLLKFLERGDLPIAEDGSILIYKVLRKQGNHYVDCHTKKVPQKVGSYVCMDESLVDPNRNNECSNGLHVARRGYIKSFSGDVCTLAKLAPEDVIAVPTYDANKMRVCGYHIIFELTPEMYQLVCANKPISDCEAGKVLLGKAMAGDHIGIIEDVRITQQLGGGVKVTPRTDAPKQPPVAQVNVVPVEALANPEKEAEAPKVDPKAVINEVATLSRKERAAQLYADYLSTQGQDSTERQKSLDSLVDFKKSCKVSWEKLGIPDPTVQATTKPETSKPKAAATKPAQKKAMTPREEIQHLLPKYKAAVGKEKTEFAQDILKLKQQAKKGWDVLGVPKDIVESIKLRTE